jgi:lysophospholipase L1-like esterase
MIRRVGMAGWAGIPLVWSLWLGVGSVVGAEGDFAIRDGDRVVFYGDSITDQRLYTTFVETYVVTRFPTRDVTFIHSGFGGDRVSGGGGGPIDTRLARDVFAYKPTVVTVMLGMNDGGYQPFRKPYFDIYSRGYRHLVESLKSHLPGVRLTLILPSPYDDVTRKPTFEGGYNRVLIQFGEFVKELAAQEGATVANLNAPVVAALKKAQEIDAARAPGLIQDRIHPGPGVQLIMAGALLRAWNAPAVVSAVAIDAAGRRVAGQENARVDGLRVEDSISWTQLDSALPMPLNPKDRPLALAIQASDVEQALNQQILRVSGLQAPHCRLKVDGEDVGEFTREQLATGINLALSSTPMFRQAQAVHDLTLRHNSIHFQRWRSVQLPLADHGYAGLSRALEALDALEAEIVAEQRAKAKPVPHRFEILLLRPSPFDEVNRP